MRWAGIVFNGGNDNSRDTGATDDVLMIRRRATTCG